METSHSLQRGRQEISRDADIYLRQKMKVNGQSTDTWLL